MKRPLIGLISAPHYDNGVFFYGLLPAYSRAIAEAGGLPVMIAPNVDEATLRATYERLDGLIMAGGGDVDAAYYGMANADKVRNIDPVRDAAELTVIRWAASEDKPTLGICRGCQMMNVALGGTLWRDIPSEYPDFTGIDHSSAGKSVREHLAHRVDLLPNTKLAAAMDVPHRAIHVNSAHHQAVRQPAPALEVSAISEDGLVEGIELPSARFFVGVQWHPEELTASDVSSRKAMQRLFRAYVAAAAEAAARG